MSSFEKSRSFILASTPSFASSVTLTGVLNSDSVVFIRPDGYGTGYYLQAYSFIVSTDGLYSFTTDSSIDTYGLLYDDIFNTSMPSGNLMAYDDDGGIGYQFKITLSLQTSKTYTLVVTTHGSFVNGSYSLIASGPVQLSLGMFLPSTIRPPPTTSKSYRESSSTRRLLYLLLDSMEYMIWFHSDFRCTYFRSFGELRWTVERYQSCVHST